MLCIPSVRRRLGRGGVDGTAHHFRSESRIDERCTRQAERHNGEGFRLPLKLRAGKVLRRKARPQGVIVEPYAVHLRDTKVDCAVGVDLPWRWQVWARLPAPRQPATFGHGLRRRSGSRPVRPSAGVLMPLSDAPRTPSPATAEPSSEPAPWRWSGIAQRSDDPRSEHVLLEQLAEIAHRLSEADDLDELLQLIVDLGEDYLEGCDGASLMLIGKNRTIASPAYSSRVAYESDLAQYEADEGPCLDALRDHRIYMIDDLETETRWPVYRARALELGVRSMLSYRLYAKGATFGALDFYARRPHAYSAFSKVIGQVFASHAGVALKGAITEAGLEQAIETRDLIGQDKGILIERLHLPANEAFKLLVGVSQRQNAPLRDIARQIVTTGEIPHHD